MLKKSETETEIQRAQVVWLEELDSNWSLNERTRCMDSILELSSWRRRNGRKRSYSKVKSKPGKNKR